MIKIAICDDDKFCIENIDKLLKECQVKFDVKIDVSTFSNGEDLVRQMKEESHFDLIYLDIQMEYCDGISIAKNIRGMDMEVNIIYVSSYDQYIEDVFDVSAMSFIRKPIKRERFFNLFHQVYKKLSSQIYFFECIDGANKRCVKYSDVVYFESCRRKLNAHMKDGTIISFYGKLNDFEERIRELNLPFIRTHQSFLVNFNFIKNRTRNEIYVVSGEVLPISRERQKSFLYNYSKCLEREIHG